MLDWVETHVGVARPRALGVGQSRTVLGLAGTVRTSTERQYVTLDTTHAVKEPPITVWVPRQ